VVTSGDQWHKDGHELASAGAGSAQLVLVLVLVLVDLGPADAGLYTCTASNQGERGD
jgi:hypothetical protein